MGAPHVTVPFGEFLKMLAPELGVGCYTVTVPGDGAWQRALECLSEGDEIVLCASVGEQHDVMEVPAVILGFSCAEDGRPPYITVVA